MKKSILLLFTCLCSQLLFAAPSWTVNPPSFQYNMSVIAKINENCIDLNNSNNIVGAFVGGACRGVTYSNVIQGSNMLAYLTIHSNVTSGETITLQYYNSVTDQVQNISATVAFVNNGVLGNSSTPFLIANNSQPTEVQLSVSSISELTLIGTKVSKITTTDPDAGNTHIYTLVIGMGDANNSMFSIIGDSIATNATFDFNLVPSLSIRLKTADNGGCHFEQILTITVINANFAPTDLLLSNISFAENLPVNTTIGTFTTLDSDLGDSHSYTLVSGIGSTDNVAFTIVGNTLKTNIIGDFAVQNSFSIRARTTDAGGLNFEKIFLITLTDSPTTPNDILLSAFSIIENLPVQTYIGTITTSDLDLGNTFTYNLVPGFGSNTLFTISNDSLFSNTIFDFETNASHSIKIRTSDNAALSFEKIFIITVINAADSPTNILLSNNIVNETSFIGFGIAKLTTLDIDLPTDTHTYSLVAGIGATDNIKVLIDNDSLRLNAILNYNLQDSLFIRLRSTDQSGYFSEIATFIKISDLNEVSTNLISSAVDFYENVTIGSIVSTFTTTDVDVWDTHTYTLVAGAGATNNTTFTIIGTNLKTAASINFEQQSSYSIRVRTTDFYGLYYEKVLLFNVKDTSDAPTDILLSSNTIRENSPLLTFVGKLTTTDEDALDQFTYSFENVGINNNSSFVMNNDSLFSTEIFDFETLNSYTIKIKSIDFENKFFIKTFVVSVLDSLDAPTNLLLSGVNVTENNLAGFSLGTFFTLDLNPTATYVYSLVSGSGDADNASFTIVNDSLKIVGVADFEIKPSYTIRAKSTLINGNFIEKDFVIIVIDAPEAGSILPVANFLSPNNDGQNDFFFIQNIALYSANQLQVFNDNGVKVFDMKSYDNSWSGKDVPDGMYYYIFNSNDTEFKGSIVLSK